MTSKFVRQSLIAGSIIMIGTNILSRLIGFVREAVTAGYFGTSAMLDTFLLAFTIPELISFVAFAALPTALIPLMRRILTNHPEGESPLFWGGAITFALIFGALSLGLYVFRDGILYLMAPTLEGVELTRGQTMAGILAWFVFFRCMEAYFRGWLFAHKHFIVPAVSSILINFVILIAIYIAYGELGIGSLAIGWLMGSIASCLFNGAFAFQVVKPSGLIAINYGVIKILLRLTVIVALVESIALLYPVVDRYLASRFLGPGQISSLRYAVFLIHIPTGIFVVSLGSAAFPWISDMSTDEQRDNLIKLYRQSIRLLIYVMLLIAAGVIIFADEITQVAFQRGAFDMESLQLTSMPLLIYATGIVFYSIYLFQMRFYYARAILGQLGGFLLIMLTAKILLSAALVKPLQHNGLAVATSCAWLGSFILMTKDLAKRMEIPALSVFGTAVPKMLVSLAVVVGVWLVLDHFWAHDPSRPLLAIFGRLVVMAVVGSGIYLGLSHLFGVVEVRRLIEKMRPGRSA